MASVLKAGDNGSFTAGFGPNRAWAQINSYYFLIALFVHRFLSPLVRLTSTCSLATHFLIRI